MQQSNIKQKWVFWHKDVVDRYDVISVLDRTHFPTPSYFYRGAIQEMVNLGAKPPYPLVIEHIVGAKDGASVFRRVADTLPDWYRIGVNEDLSKFVIVRPNNGEDATRIVVPDEIVSHGKWLLFDDVAMEKYTVVAVKRIHIEDDHERYNVFGSFYRGAIEVLMLCGGAKVTYITQPFYIWDFPCYDSLPAMFLEAVETLQDPYRVAVSEDLLRFFLVRPK